MKDIRLAIRSLLTGDPAIAAIITVGGISRVYPGTLPQGTTLPSVVQNLITESSDYHLIGPSYLGQSRMQIDCWAQLPDDAVLLADLVLDKLSGYSGVTAVGSSSPQDTIDVEAIFHDQGRDDFDATAKMYTRRRDYLIWFRQS